jgi:LacI family transcriptional regulator, galactose operon repressor
LAEVTHTVPTIADVAKLAGVSIGTVSRVMNGADNVRPGTRAKVNQAIATLGYEPNFQARSLRSKRTDTIALAIPELSNYFWTTIARGVQDASQAKGYHVLICNTNGRPSRSLRYLELMINRADGLILSRRSERVIVTPEEGQSKQQEKPIVFVGQSQAASWNVDNVYSDSISGAFALTQHLIRLHHRKIAIITGRQSSASANDRVAGYCMALAGAELPNDPERICWGEYDRKTAERLTHDLIERLPDTTAIVAANNEIAIGVIQALEKRHLPVPESVAVVCFDDFYPDSRFATMMTVASQSPYDLGVNAAQLLLNRLNSSEHLRPQTVVLPVRLIVRQSCGGEPSPVEPETAFDHVRGQLIRSLPRQEIEALAAVVRPILTMALPSNDVPLFQGDKAQITSLKRALRREAVDFSMLPHFEYAITNQALYRYVLERDPEIETHAQTALIVPEDQIEFAQRSGLAAIPCRFPYQPTLAHEPSDDEQPWFDFPLFTDLLDFFDRYVRAARNTNVGIAADFRSIVGDTLRIADSLGWSGENADMSWLEKVADDLADYQTKVVQLICDRFGAEIAFVVFSDDLADMGGLRVPLDMFQAVFSERLRRLLHPAQEHGLLTVLYTPGALQPVIPLVRQLGFDGVYLAQPEGNNLAELWQEAGGQLSFMGGIPASALVGNVQLGDVSALVAQLGRDGGCAIGVSGEITDQVSVGGFFSLVSALSSFNA